MSDNGQFDKFSADAWNSHNIREIEVDEHLGVRYRLLDPTQFMLTGEEDFNPFLEELMSTLVANEGEGKYSLKTDLAMPDIFGIVSKVANAKVAATLHQRFDNYLIKAVVAPPLVEQGHEHGASVSQIPLVTKIEIFVDLIGGEELVTQLKSFLRGQAARVETRPASETVRADAKPPAERGASRRSVPIE